MSIGDHELREGIYESLITEQLSGRLRDVGLASELRRVDDADLAHVLGRHVSAVVERALRSARSSEERLAIANDILERLESLPDVVTSPAEQLIRLSATPGPGVVALPIARPATPLSDTALLTNAQGEPNLGAEVRAEIDTANGVDLLCAFVKWHGLRLLEHELMRLRERGARFRVITTTYMGATERSAIDRLIREFNAEVKVQYDAARTRLHAKAWMFRRETRFDTAYVGSSNLSRAAMLDGVEWNVRLSGIATPQLLDKFTATFETYWNDPSFESYSPDRDRDRLDDALGRSIGAPTARPGHDLPVWPRSPALRLPARDARARWMLSAQCMSDIATLSSRQQAPARPWWLPSTIAPCCDAQQCASPIPAVCRPPPGDSGAVPADLSGSLSSLRFRRALRGRCEA